MPVLRSFSEDVLPLHAILRYRDPTRPLFGYREVLPELPSPARPRRQPVGGSEGIESTSPFEFRPAG
jgi:hypothetical protein